MASICVAVITRNEEKNIAECLAGAAWADEILVLDSLSTDGTVELARRQGARVFQRAFTNFAEQRNAALCLARSDWVLFVDADERISPALAEEIRQQVEATEQDQNLVCGFWVPRENHIWGKVIRHAGWYPDYQLRLLRRGRASYDPAREVHELVRLEGEGKYLSEPLIHYNYHSIRQFATKQKLYSAIQARSMLQAGIRPKPHNYVLQPLREFWRRYVRLRGWQDGWRGLLLAVLMGYYTLDTYLTLRRLTR
jgi:glycosyltransferase involved in cell wall biosynthesis